MFPRLDRPLQTDHLVIGKRLERNLKKDAVDIGNHRVVILPLDKGVNEMKKKKQRRYDIALVQLKEMT